MKMNGNYEGHVFGKEETVQEIVTRIAWEHEAEGLQRRAGNHGLADGHALARATYIDLLAKRETPNRTIVIHGRLWYGGGNTYHSVEVTDGMWSTIVPFTYGYGDAFIETAHQALIDAGRLPPAVRHQSGGKESLRAHCESKGIKLVTTSGHVNRRKDLHNGGY